MTHSRRAIASDELCGAKSPGGFYCTLPRAHGGGLHQDRRPGPLVVWRWYQR